ncbi:MAG: hypothetical protein ACR2OB_12320 [Solirubrobacteraceae bacterium]
MDDRRPRSPEPAENAPRRPRSPEPAEDAARRRPRSVRITERDRELLAFAADHRLVLAAHVQVLLGVSAGSAYSRLRSLTAAGMLKQRTVFHHQPGCYRITGPGLAVAGSKLPAPRLDYNCYEHDVGVAWLWLAARDGAFGSPQAVLSERQIRSHDASPDGRGAPYAVRLGGIGPGGQPRLHYPDLLVTDRDGHRVALELELTSKGRTRREQILAGYGADRGIDVVLYLTDKDAVARSIRASAARLGISDRVHVQRVSWSDSASAAGAGVAAERKRATPEPRESRSRTRAVRSARTPTAPARGAVR